MPQPGAPETTDSKGFVERRTVQNRDTGEEFTTIQKFARALQGLGAGLQGQTAPFFQQDIEREKLRAQQEQDIQGQQLAQVKIRQAQVDIALKGLDYMGKAATQGQGMSTADREKHFTTSAALISSLMQKAGVQDATQIHDPAVVKQLMYGMVDAGIDPEEFVGRWMYLPPEGRNVVKGLVTEYNRTRDPKLLNMAAEHGKDISDQELQKDFDQFLSMASGQSPERLAAAGITNIDEFLNAYAQALPTNRRQAFLTGVRKTDDPSIERLASMVGVTGRELTRKKQAVTDLAKTTAGTTLGALDIRAKEAEIQNKLVEKDLTLAKTQEIKDAMANVFEREYKKEAGKLKAQLDYPLPPKPDDADRYRGQYENNTQTREWKVAKLAYARFGELQKEPDSPIKHLSLIITYAKIMDPGSVVREGEVWTIQSARTVWDSLRARYQYVIGGGSLTPAQVKEISGQINAQFKGMLGQQKDMEANWKDMAKNQGLPGHALSDVLGTYRDWKMPGDPSLPKAMIKSR